MVTRWNAMRELLDSMEGFVADTRRERDRILEERRVEQEIEAAGWLRDIRPMTQGEL
jgi:hypothetical protein